MVVGKEKRMKIWIYIFEDGTVLKLLDVGFSCQELWALKKLHGKAKVSNKKV